jgi:Tol biopolymer transport system component/erythromycin esterase-like protein
MPLGGGSDLIAFSSPRDGESTIFTVSIETGQVTRVTDTGSRLNQPTWSPDGQRIGYVHWSGGEELDIWLMNADGTERTRVTSILGHRDIEPSWSPDGTKIAFTSSRDSYLDSIGDEVFVMNLYLVDLRTLRQVQLTDTDDWDTDPDWSPDSEQLVWQGEQNRNNEIMVMSIDGSESRNLTRHRASDSNPAWSPDGSQIAFVSDRDGNEEIYVMNRDGSNVLRLTHNPDRDKAPAWSPDGEWLAYQSEQNRNFDIFIMRADGSEQRQLTRDRDFDGFPSWRPPLAPISSDPFTLEVDREALQEYISFRTMSWIGEHAVPLLTREAIEFTTDLQPVFPVIGGSRAVDLSGLGLGTQEDFTLRHRLIEFLNGVMGFDTLVLEIGRVAGQQLDRYVSSGVGDPVVAIESIEDPRWHNTAFLGLIEWARGRSAAGFPIRIYGVGPSESWQPLDVIEGQIIAMQSGSLAPSELPFHYLGEWDRVVEANVHWVIEQLDPEAKLVIWGNHVDLLRTTDPAPGDPNYALATQSSLGERFGRALGEQPFAIGLAYGRGAMTGYEGLDVGLPLDLVSIPSAPPGSFEWMGTGAGLSMFLLPDLSANADSMLDRQILGRALLTDEAEFIFQPVNFAQAFNALIYVDEVRPTTLLIDLRQPADELPLIACAIQSLCFE